MAKENANMPDITPIFLFIFPLIWAIPFSLKNQANALLYRALFPAPRGAVHPLSIAPFRLSPERRLRAGNPAAPGRHHLPLLPSGPDGVRGYSAAQDPLVNAAAPGQSRKDGTWRGSSTPL